MTIKAFSRECLQGYIASKLIEIQHKNSLIKDWNDTRKKEKDKKELERDGVEFHYYSDNKDCTLACVSFTHPSQAPETDLICECGYTVIEYDKKKPIVEAPKPLKSRTVRDI